MGGQPQGRPRWMAARSALSVTGWDNILQHQGGHTLSPSWGIAASTSQATSSSSEHMEGVQAAWEGLWFGYPQSRKQGRRLTVDAAPIALLTMCAAPASPSPASQSSACSVPCFKLDQFSASQSQTQVSNTSSFHHPMFSTSPVSIAIISRCAQFQFLQLSTSPVFF